MNRVRHATFNKLLSVCMLLSMSLAPLGPAGAGVEAAPLDAPLPIPAQAAPAAPAADVNPGLSKAWSSGSPIVGTDVRYQIYFYADSVTTTHSVVITDVLPTDTGLVSWYGNTNNPYVDLDQTIQVVQVGNQLVWNLGDLTGGCYGYIYPTLHISDTAVPGELMTNTVQLTTSDNDTDLNNNTDERTDTLVAPTRDVQVTKSFNDGTPIPGNTVRHRIWYRNGGNVAARDVVLTDTLPAGLEYVSYSDYSWSVAQAGATLVLTRAELGAGYSGNVYVTVRITDTAAPGEILTNTAVITTSDPDTDPSNNASSLGMAVVAPTWDVEVDKGLSMSSLQPAPGNDIVYQIGARNNQGSANATAHDIVVTDTLPAQLSYVSHQASGWTAVVTAGSTLVFTRAELPPEWGWNYLYVTAHLADGATPGETLTNVVSISTNDADGNLANNVVTDTTPVADPTRDVSVSKSLYSGSPTPGNNLRYRIHYENSGNRPAENVVVTDTFPMYTTFVTFTQGSYPATWDSGHITWTLGTLQPGVSGNLYVTVRLSDQVAVGTRITNTAGITTTSPETNATNNAAQDSGQSVRAGTSNVYVNKALVDYCYDYSVGGYCIPTGVEVAYHIEYSNSSVDAALGVVLTDTLPEGTSYVTSTGAVAPSVDGRQLVWQLGSLPGGAGGSLDVTVDVGAGIAAGTRLTNTVAFAASNASSVRTDEEARVAITATHDLYVNKSLNSGSSIIGTDMTYRIDYRNHGNARTHGVVLTDTLPAGLSFVSASPLTPRQVGNQLVWDLGTLPSYNTSGSQGNLYVTVHVLEATAHGTELCNRVDIATTDAETGTYQNWDEDCRDAQAPTRDMYVSKSLNISPSQGKYAPLAGHTIEYQLRYRNQGNMPARDVILTDTLPAGVSYVGHTASDWTTVQAGPTLVLTRAQVNAYSSGYVYLQVRVADTAQVGDELVNVADIATGDVDVDPSDNQATLTTQVVAPSRDLVVSKYFSGSSSDKVPGSVTSYWLSFDNTGNYTATNVILTDTLPAGFRYESHSATGWTLVMTSPLVLSRPELLPDSSGSIYLSARILSPTVQPKTLVTNTVEISTGDEESDYTDNTYTDSFTTLSPGRDLRVTKSWESGQAAAGETLQYRIDVWNLGMQSASGLVLTDTLPPELSFVSQSDNYFWPIMVQSGNVITWTRRYAMSGDSRDMIYLTVRVTDTATGGQALNTVELSGSDPDADPSDNQDSLSIPLAAQSRDLSVSKSTVNYFVQGHTVTYTIYYRNYGQAAASNVVVTDTLPPGLTFVRASNGGQHSAGVVVWNLGSVPGRGTGNYYAGELDLVAQIPASMEEGSQQCNQVQIATSDTETGLEPNVSRLCLNVDRPKRDMYVYKSLSGTPLPGSRVDYWISIYNGGNSTAHDVVVTDTLPAGVTYVSHDLPAGWQTLQTSPALIIARSEVAAGYSQQVRLTVDIPAAAVPGTPLVNKVEVSTIDVDEDLTNDEDTDTSAVAAPRRDVAITKSLYSSPGAPGGRMTYRLRLDNYGGNSTARDVTVTDTLPAGVSYVSWSSQSWSQSHILQNQLVTEAVSGGQVVWNLDELPAGQSGNIYLTVRVAPGLNIGDLLTNTAEISTSDVDVDPADNDVVLLTTLVSPTQNMAVYKILYWNSNPWPGNEVRYNIEVQNLGNYTATNVVLTDTLPPELSYVGFTGSGWTAVVTSGGQVVLTHPALDAEFDGYVYLTVRITDTAQEGDVLTNVVAIDLDQADTSLANNVYTSTTTVSVPKANLRIYKYLTSSYPVPGGKIRYQLSFYNWGNATAHNVMITDTLPAGATFESWNGWIGSYPHYNILEHLISPIVSGQDVAWPLGELAPNQWGYIYYSVRLASTVAVGSRLTNTVVISTPDVDSDPSNNDDEVGVVVTDALDVSVYKWVEGTPLVGDEINYWLNVDNNSGASAHDVLVTDTLPADVTYDSHWAYGWTTVMTGPVVVLSRPTLGPYETSRVRIGARINDVGVNVGDVLTNVIETSAMEAEARPVDNIYTQTIPVVAPGRDMHVEKFLESAPGHAGGEMEYRIEYSNDGNQPASNVVLTDTLPVSTTYVSSSGAGPNPDVVGGQVVWHLGTVEAGHNAYLWLTVRITDTAQVGGVLTNVVEVSTTDVDADPNNDSDTLLVDVSGPTRDVEVWKNLDGQPGTPGGLMKYELWFTNHGNSTAANVVLTDTLPVSVTFVSWSDSLTRQSHTLLGKLVTETVANGQVVWPLGSVSPGDSDWIYVTVRVNAPTQVKDILENRAAISTSDPDVDLANNTSTETTRALLPWVDLEISKSADWATEPNVASPGRDFTYRIYFENDGNLPATGVVVTDTLSPGATYVAWGGYGYPALAPTFGTGWVSWNVGTLAAGQSEFFTLTVRVPGTANVGDTLVNVVEIEGREDDFEPGSNVFTHTDELVASGCLELTGLGIGGPARGYTDTEYVFTALLQPSNATRPIDYTWHDGKTTASANFSWSEPGVKTITVTAHQSCSGASFTAVYTITIVTPPPGCTPLSGVSIEGPGTGFTGDPLTFTADTQPADATEPITYTWSPEPASGQGSANAVYSWTSSGLKTISVTVQNCAGDLLVDEHLVLISSYIAVDDVAISGPATGFAGTSYTFNATVSPADASPAISYDWSPTPLSGQGTASVSYRWLVTGTQTISVSASNRDGSASDTFTVTINPEPPVSTTVGPAGGVYVVYTDTHGLTTTLEVPPGAVDDPIELRYTVVPVPGSIPSGLVLLGNGFDLDAYRGGQPLVGFTFSKTVTLTIRYLDDDLAGPPPINENSLELYRLAGSAWELVGTRPGEGQQLYPASNTLKAWLTSLSRFAAFGRAVQKVYLPVVIKNG